MSENATPNCSVLDKQSGASKSSVVFESTTQKQEQVILKYRETNAALAAFKKKTEEAITAELQKLEKERNKTSEILAEIRQKNMRQAEELASQQEQAIHELEKKPVFDDVCIASISRSISNLRSQNSQLRTHFTIKFADFMDTFKSTKATAQKACNPSIQAKLSETADDVKQRLARLQTLIGQRCDELCAAVSGISATPQTTLSLSSPVTVEQAAPAPKRPAEPSHLTTLSPFLTRWFSENANLL